MIEKEPRHSTKSSLKKKILLFDSFLIYFLMASPLTVFVDFVFFKIKRKKTTSLTRISVEQNGNDIVDLVCLLASLWGYFSARFSRYVNQLTTTVSRYIQAVDGLMMKKKALINAKKKMSLHSTFPFSNHHNSTCFITDNLEEQESSK